MQNRGVSIQHDFKIYSLHFEHVFKLALFKFNSLNISGKRVVQVSIFTLHIPFDVLTLSSTNHKHSETFHHYAISIYEKNTHTQCITYKI